LLAGCLFIVDNQFDNQLQLNEKPVGKLKEFIIQNY